MKYCIAMIEGKNGRIWFVEADGSVWVYDPRNRTGLDGDIVTFCMGDQITKPILVLTVGPWAASSEGLEKETGFKIGVKS